MHGLPTAAFYVFCSAVFTGLMVWAWRTAQPGRARDAFLAPAFALAMALMLLFAPHYAWYIIWLVPFFALMPNPPVLVYLTGFFYLYTTAYAMPGPGTFFLNEILYGATLCAFVVWMAMRRWPVHRRLLIASDAPTSVA
jgi:hypothetical protein